VATSGLAARPSHCPRCSQTGPAATAFPECPQCHRPLVKGVGVGVGVRVARAATHLPDLPNVTCLHCRASASGGSKRWRGVVVRDHRNGFFDVQVPTSRFRTPVLSVIWILLGPAPAPIYKGPAQHLTRRHVYCILESGWHVVRCGSATERPSVVWPSRRRLQQRWRQATPPPRPPPPPTRRNPPVQPLQPPLLPPNPSATRGGNRTCEESDA